MRLSALEAVGFKSFAKHTRLEFRESVTAIVGPNGSGKSNIADAIRWVLGEQSMKTLRGKKSEDVIFSGSAARGRLGMAEISLTLANEDGSAPLDAAEVVITRQLTRAGDSQYLLNGRPVRLLDVADLLAKAGFGQKTYTVIGQGMADAFVNASPTERRQMFEDATGVTPLLLKKEQTERKLDATREHLTRARDLLGELEPRLRSLKRQASRARSREEVERELREHETAWYTHLWHEHTASLRQAAGQVGTLDARIAQLAKKLAALRPAATSSESAAHLPRLRAAIDALRTKEQDITVELARRGVVGEEAVDRRAEEHRAREKEQLKLAGLISETEVALRAKNHLLQEARDHLRTLQRDLLSLQSAQLEGARLEAVREDLEEALAREEMLLDHLHALEDIDDLPPLQEEAEHIKQHLAHVLERLDAPDSSPRGTSTTKLREQLETHSRTRDDLEEASANLRARLATLTAQLRSVEERLAHLSQARAVSDVSTVDRLREELDAVRAEREQQSEEADELERQLLAAQTQRASSEAETETLREHIRTAEREKHSIEIAIAGTQARKEDVEHEATARLGPEFVAELSSGRIARPGGSATTREADMHRLREKLAQIGGIDPTVLKEETEVEGRVTTLREQVHDLDGAVKHLREGLRELDAHIHRQFSDGMRSMTDAFNTYFRQIFGGGRAALSVVKPRPVEHVLPDVAPGEELGTQEEETAELPEAGPHVHELPPGVEIRANPPGKKLTALSQLSGGEKALTSVALLFAILSQRPSPFVVLDEVDAALDEANSRRFARMVGELSKTSQFLVITHNRATMEAAGALYGVTMGEDGISQVLSVRLTEVPEDLVGQKHAARA
jgi:chromosome segregation protein